MTTFSRMIFKTHWRKMEAKKLTTILWILLWLMNDWTVMVIGSDLGGCSKQPMTDTSSMTAFWINLDSSVDRQKYMTTLLDAYGFRHVRVPAFTPNSKTFKDSIVSLQKPCKRNTDTDIAVIMSHLLAIHTAIYHDPNPNSPYALILEDDIRFLFAVNFTSLISSVPKEFGILQLTTSNAEALDMLWDKHQQGIQWIETHWRNTTKNGKTYLYWSAQAYLIQKRVVRAFLDDVITTDKNNQPVGYRIHNSFYPQSCHRTKKDPCILAFCLFSDSYIYAAGQPTYVSTVSFVTGGRIGWNSTIHPLEVNSHRVGFTKIRHYAGLVKHSLRGIDSVNASTATLATNQKSWSQHSAVSGEPVDARSTHSKSPAFLSMLPCQ